ncbi:MAG: LptA/OstA family protein [Burkholderiales bacterium]|jgi:lipopolysaccharide transport protein LptA
MRSDPARTARRALLGLVLVVCLAVAWSLLRPKPSPPPPTRPAPSPGAGTTVGDLQFLRYRDDNRKIDVKAKEAVKQEGDTMLMRGVDASMPFVNEGRAGILTIRAEECQYQPSLERAAFKGKVLLRTDDGFELETETLKYWGDKQRAFTGDPLRFKRGSMSGTATGLEYRPGEGLLLRESVKVRIEDPQGPADIESQSATGSREERVFTFTGAVKATQGARELRANDLRLDMNQGMDAVERATATGNVDLVTGAGAALPGSTAPSAGSKRLRGQRLEAIFRGKGVLQQVTASDAASLDLEPGPEDSPERRRVTAPRLRFEFDEQGALVSLHAPGAGAARVKAGASRLAVLMAEPLDPAKGTPRRVESETFDAALDPVSGDPKGAEFAGAVQFTEPGRKAWASRSSYDGAASTLVMTGDPRILDEGEGSELKAQTITIGTRSRAVSAHGNVRHSIARKTSAKRPGMFGGEATLIVCRDFEYDPTTRTARYQVNALVRSGTDEVRAPLITLEEPAPGKRRMTASGGTTSLLHPRPSKDAAKPPAPVDARSKEMVYEEAAGRVVYTGDVEIRQGDILTKSPEAIAVLTKDGNDLEKLLAGEPVEVHQGQRRANGERGVYTPANETFVLTGEKEKVVLFDGDRKLLGRILTFESGNDRIRVDGREEERTEAVFRRKEPPKP